MSFSFAKYLYNEQAGYNGHGQATINSLSLEDGLEIAKELEALDGGEHFFVVEVYTDGGFSILAKDWWKRGDHQLGHVDKLFLGAENQ